MKAQQASWAKLQSGDWGVRLPHDSASPGETVTIVRRDGTDSDEVLGIRIAGGPNWSLWTVAAKGAAAPPPRKAVAVKPQVRVKNWKPCGYPGCGPNHCDECDGDGAGSTGGF